MPPPPDYFICSAPIDAPEVAKSFAGVALHQSREHAGKEKPEADTARRAALRKRGSLLEGVGRVP